VSHIAFTGLQPPDLDVPLIELTPDEGGAVDLYNECRLVAVMLKGSQLAFDFTPRRFEPRLAWASVRECP
jgi:hypothetical protein